MVLNSISYYPIFGLPLIAYLGMVTLLMLLLTMSVSISYLRGWKWLGFKWHPRLAFITLGLAIIHGTLAVLIYF
jgi:hypothetical protein